MIWICASALWLLIAFTWRPLPGQQARRRRNGGTFRKPENYKHRWPKRKVGQ